MPYDTSVQPIRILFAEDSSDDATLVLQSLRRAGYDPTAVVASDDAAAAERDLLRVVLDANTDLIFVKDGGGRFTVANRAVAALYGTTVEGLIGRCEMDVNPHGGETARSAAAEQKVLASGRPTFTAGEAITDPRTGATRWFDVRRVPLAMPGGTHHVLAVAVETTDRRQAAATSRANDERARLSQKMEAIGQLAGGVAHEFNNLLTTMLGYTSLLIDATGDRPELSADLQEIKRAGDRASGLTQQLLTFSRRQVVPPALVDLNDVVSEVEKMLRQVVGDIIEIDVVKAPSLGQIRADPSQIEQVLVNLAANARDAMPDGGVLRIQTKTEMRPADPANPASAPVACVSLVVSDTGTGIPADVGNRIFEPFFTTKGQGKGMGLGLAMVYGIVTQADGTIAVESEPGRGSIFTIRFPAAAAPAVESRRPPVTFAGTETILLVEDEAAVRNLVVRVLSAKGYRVLEARDVPHAIEIASEHPSPIDMLLSDVVMPGMNGPDLAKVIAPKRPGISVLYMSGFASRLSAELGATDPNVAILSKPFTPESLARGVRERLDSAVRS